MGDMKTMPIGDENPDALTPEWVMRKDVIGHSVVQKTPKRTRVVYSNWSDLTETEAETITTALNRAAKAGTCKRPEVVADMFGDVGYSNRGA